MTVLPEKCEGLAALHLTVFVGKKQIEILRVDHSEAIVNQSLR